MDSELNFVGVRNFARMGVGLSPPRARAGIDSALDTEALRGRGVDDLVEEFEATPDASRADYLLQFLTAFSPRSAPDPERLTVYFATTDDLNRLGLVRPIFVGSDTPVAVPTAMIPDLGLSIINLGACRVFSDQTVLTAGGLYLVEQVRHMHPNWMLENINNSRLDDLDLEKRTGRIKISSPGIRGQDDKVYFLFHGFIGTTSFGHYMVDVLGQLAAYDALRVQFGKKLTPVIAKDHEFIFKWPGMEWLFQMLIGPVDHILHLREDVQLIASQAFTTTRAVVGGEGGICAEASRYLHAKIHSTIAQTSANRSSPERVFVNRKHAGREANNISEVESVFLRHGFESIAIEDLKPAEVLQLLRGARVIAGMHGSNLMYHYYMERPGFVVEIEHETLTWKVILATARACGHEPFLIRDVGGQTDLIQLEDTLGQIGDRLEGLGAAQEGAA